MVGAPHVVQPWMPRAARAAKACVSTLSCVGGARRRGCAAGGVSEFCDGLHYGVGTGVASVGTGVVAVLGVAVATGGVAVAAVVGTADSVGAAVAVSVASSVGVSVA